MVHEILLISSIYAWVGCSWSDLTPEFQFRQGAAAPWDAHCEHRCFPGRGTQNGGGACECRHTKTGDEASLQCQFIILNPRKSTHAFNFSHHRHPTPPTPKQWDPGLPVNLTCKEIQSICLSVFLLRYSLLLLMCQLCQDTVRWCVQHVIEQN